MTPRVVPDVERRAGRRSSYEEFRSRGRTSSSFASRDMIFWRYLTEPEVFPVVSELTGSLHPGTMDDEEFRVLSKATNAAGGYVVPQDFDDQVSSVRRARAVIGNLAREIVTDEGSALLMPAATTHGVSTWTAESAAYTASDETFSQVSIGAFKAATKVIASEELAQDAAGDFDRWLADELGSGSRCSRKPRSQPGTGPASRSASFTRARAIR